MWTKHDYLCTDCDALYEITTQQSIPKCFEPECSCGSNNVIKLGDSEASGPLLEPVTKITPRQVVKINSNPYN